MWVNHGQSWSKFQTVVEKNINFNMERWKFSFRKKKLTWFDCRSTWSKIGKNGILVILTLNVKNKIIHYPIGINSVVLKKILIVPWLRRQFLQLCDKWDFGTQIEQTKYNIKNMDLQNYGLVQLIQEVVTYFLYLQEAATLSSSFT